jgi:hypothetical protein
MFIAYTPLQQLPSTRKHELSINMALAAIIGDQIYNFGEVLATPLLSTLKGTTEEWLYDIVVSLNDGRVSNVDAIIDAHRERFFGNQELASNHENIKQKAVLLSLMNIAFERPSHARIISFADIASRTNVTIDKVRAFASLLAFFINKSRLLNPILLLFRLSGWSSRLSPSVSSKALWMKLINQSASPGCSLGCSTCNNWACSTSKWIPGRRSKHYTSRCY